MRPNMKSTGLVWPIVLAVLASCILDQKEARRGSVVENEVAGILFDQDGKPVEGATVKVLPVDYIPKGGLVKAAADSMAVRSVKTGPGGRYVLDSLPAGEYNILGELEGTYSYLDSIAYSETLDSLPSDTLRAPGSLTGHVLLEPNHDPRSVFIQVLGTNVFVNADKNGRFTMREMAGGEYSLRILSTLDGYPPAFPSIRIRSGVEDTLDTPISLAYTGIPVVRSLEAAYDTAMETATLRWPPAEYAFLREYLVFRSAKGALNLPSAPIARVRDTFYTDPVSHLAGLGGHPVDLEYRVRVSNLSDSVGPAFAIVEVRAMPRESIAFSLDFQTTKPAQLRGAKGDTVAVIVGWQSSFREADSLEWTLGDGNTIRTVKVSGRTGNDTAHVVLPEETGPFSIQVLLLDRSRMAWEGTLNGWVEEGMPVAHAGSDTVVTISDTVYLRGSGEDPYGRIVKMEWDIGNTGSFVQVEAGDTTVVAPSEVTFQSHVLRVTDDEGNVALDTLRLTAMNDRPRVSLVWYINSVAQGGGYLLKSATTDRGRAVKWEWDFGNGVFVNGFGPDTTFHPDTIGGTKLNIRIRVTDDDGNQAMAQEQIPVSKWEYLADLPSSFDIAATTHQEFRLTAFKDKLYVIAQRVDDSRDIRFASFEPGTGIWTTLTPPPYIPSWNGICVGSSTLVGTQDKILFVTPSYPANQNSGILEFDPRLGDWDWIDDAPLACDGVSAVAVDSILYLMDADGSKSRLHSYNLSSGMLNRDIALQDNLRVQSSAFLKGWLYAIGVHAGGSVIGNPMYTWSKERPYWVQAEYLPWHIFGLSLVAATDKLYAMGKSEKSVFSYDRTSNKWTLKSPMLWYSGDNSSTELNGIIYSIGDRKIQRYDPASEP